MLYPRIKDELTAMFQIDQEMRHRNLKEPDYWDSTIDRKHTARIKELVAQIGWPTVSKVGSEGSHAAWLLVQHADHDVDFQKECLTLMKSAPEGEVERRDVAYLEDRVRVNSNQLQLYGTQFIEVNGTFVPRGIECLEKVDERRLSMGLGTLQKGIEQMRETYRAKPSSP